MKFKVEKFRVTGKLKHPLAHFPTTVPELGESGVRDELSERQNLFYVDGRYGLVMIFQGMDTAGKDGAIKHVMSGLNPQGISVTSFGVPSREELKHDFLWRAHAAVAPRGKFTIFNRSYYEEVLTVRIHNESLIAENLSPELLRDKKIWRERLKDIRHFEDYLARQGFRVLKFFLHISKAEQKNRLLSRLEEPKKNWKLEMSDVHERGFWKKYQAAYESAISETATEEAPWFVIPADDKKNARLIISHIIASELTRLPLGYPALTPEKKSELKRIRKELAKS